MGRFCSALFDIALRSSQNVLSQAWSVGAVCGFVDNFFGWLGPFECSGPAVQSSISSLGWRCGIYCQLLECYLFFRIRVPEETKAGGLGWVGGN